MISEQVQSGELEQLIQKRFSEGWRWEQSIDPNNGHNYFLPPKGDSRRNKTGRWFKHQGGLVPDWIDKEPS